MNDEYIDIEPLLISISDNTSNWTHPEIEKYFNPVDVGRGIASHDVDVYRIYFKNSENNTMYVIFKSNYLDKKIKDFNVDNQKKQELFKKPYIDTPNVYDALKVVLWEDIWSPGGMQFAFTSFGKIVSDFMSSNAEVDFFSLDCGLYKDEDSWNWES